jgi:hypothetical protein
MKLSNDPTYIPTTDTVRVQITGGSVTKAISNLLDTYEMGYDVVPVMGDEIVNGEIVSNILNFDFRVIKGKDRTVGNTEGNNPVVFSYDLKNVLSSEYTVNKTDYLNCAYVAGEGDGAARKVIQAGDSTLTNADRRELYVDARDLQSTDENGNVLTTAEYEAALTNRGNEKLADNIINKTFDCSIDKDQKKYKYGVDYYKGDLITVIDEALNISMSARVTAVSITSLGIDNYIELTLGYEKLTVAKKLEKGGLL